MALFAARTSPLDIPEIRAMVGQHLDRSDLARYLRVCKSWHASFLPLVWSYVSISQTGCNPPVESLHRYMHLVKDLFYDMTLWQEQYESIHCPNLLSLEVLCEESSTVDIAHYDHLSELVVRVYSPVAVTKCPAWKLAHSMQNLLHLEVKYMNLDTAATDAFWDLCTQLETLDAQSIRVERLPDTSMSFKQLCWLAISFRSVHPLEEQLVLITQCPNLVKLDWSGNRDSVHWFIPDAFAIHAANGAWPNLTQLRLGFDCPLYWDEQFTKIIHGMRQVKDLVIDASKVGPPIVMALRPHFQALRRLNIGFDHTVTGSAIPEILASCPRLEHFSMFGVKSQDVIQSRPWACEPSMRTLHLNIIIPSGRDADGDQQLVLERISRFVNLESLYLTHLPVGVEGTYLSLQVGKGLEQLGTLKRLTELKFAKYDYELSTVDARVTTTFTYFSSFLND